MKKEVNDKLLELAQNEEFVERFMNAGSIQAAKRLLEDEGINLTDEELVEAIKDGKTLLKEQGYFTENDELTEKALEEVSGGRAWGRVLLGGLLAIGGVYTGNGGVAFIGALIAINGWNS